MPEIFKLLLGEDGALSQKMRNIERSSVLETFSSSPRRSKGPLLVSGLMIE